MLSIKGEARQLLKKSHSRGYTHTIEHHRGVLKITLFDGPILVAEQVGYQPLPIMEKLWQEMREHEEVSECMTASMQEGECWWIRQNLDAEA